VSEDEDVANVAKRTLAKRDTAKTPRKVIPMVRYRRRTCLATVVATSESSAKREYMA
jgi:hypothetical protein